MQQMLLGIGAKDDPVYVDQVFNTYVYRGSSSAQTFNTGVDLANEGGLIWSKYRTMNSPGVLFDTERGKTKVLRASASDAEGTANTAITSFNNNGFSVGGGDGWTNFNSNHTFATWIWRKAPGFFDCIKFDGDGTAGRTLSHSLGCVPGMIMIKQLDESNEWTVYHRSLGKDKYIYLNSTAGSVDDTSNGYYWDNTAPTATQITLGDIWDVNKNNAKYVCYLFAGGEVTDTSRSVEFDGSGDSVSIPDSSDLDFGSGDYTVECWFRQTGAFQDWRSILAKFDGSGSIWIHTGSGGKIAGGYNQNAIAQQSGAVQLDTWNHVAISRSGTSWRLFLNGAQMGSTLTESGSNDNNHALLIGDIGGVSGREFEGQISNVRVVKGTALYTSSFKPQLKTVENITNTKLLCCNSSSVTGSTVTPGTITTNGNPTASTLSPGFDDPAGFTFGASGSENVIKCGSYVGNGSGSNEVFVGFEPQWVMIKNASTGGTSWYMMDAIRGIPTDRYVILQADKSDEEYDYSGAMINATPTGFKVVNTSNDVNKDGDTLVYIAIRRPDGYVGKPPELGTDVFSMDTGASSTTIPNYDSGFPVDFGLIRQPAGSDNWQAVARLIQKKALSTDQSSAEYGASDAKFDSNVGFMKEGRPSSVQAWMWKRHAGFDVVTYTGGGASSAPRSIPHSLNKPPEMIWTKNRDSNVDWVVWHKDLNGGGNNAASYNLRLNDEDDESSNSDIYGGANNVLPTSTHWTTGGNNMINENGSDFISLLFATTDVSKVGSYSGDNSGQTITTGFQPRFIIIKQLAYNSWFVFDTVRGWSQNNQDWFLRLEGSYAQSDNVNDRPDDIGHPLSTGFYLKGDTNNDLAATNKTGNSYIYYCHA